MLLFFRLEVNMNEERAFFLEPLAIVFLFQI